MTAVFKFFIGVIALIFGYFIITPLVLAQSEPPEIVYTFENHLGDEVPSLEVSILFDGSASGVTELTMAPEWGGQTDFFNSVQNLTCLTAGCEITAGAEPFEFIVSHAPGALLSISYSLVQDWQGPLSNEIYYRARLNADYFHFIGHTALVIPSDYQNGPVNLITRWIGFPNDWVVINSFGEGTATTSRFALLDDFQHALFVGGDFHIETIDINGADLKVAVRGDWDFPLEEFYALASDITLAQRTFWDDFETPYFLITMIPIDGPCCSLGGTSLKDTFALFVSSNQTGTEEFKFLLAHELMHTWIGQAIAPAEPEEYMYWFTEGFTNYYTRLLNLRAGIITLEQYLADYNQVLENYFYSSARNATRDDVQEKFWSDAEIGKLPYQQGDILAHNWNALIRNSPLPRSLDNVMADMLAAARDGAPGMTQDRLDHFFRVYTTGGVLGDTRAAITRGETIYPAADGMGACFSLIDLDKHAFDLGFASERSGPSDDILTITGVTAGHNAAAAGLVPGMVITGYSIQFGKSDVEVALTVRDGDELRDIAYLPWGEAAIIPQYQLEDRYTENPADCLGWFQAG